MLQIKDNYILYLQYLPLEDLNGYDRWGFSNPSGLLREQYSYFQHHFILGRNYRGLEDLKG